MLNLWLTRTRPGLDRQAADLAAAGYSVLAEPVIGIESLNVDGRLRSQPYDAVIYLSEHAVRLGPTLPRSYPAPRVFAVGRRTAAALAEQGIDATVPARESSEGLLGLSELARPAGVRVLLVSGSGGRQRLSRTLEQRGASVTQMSVYRRVPRRTMALDPGVIDVIVAASGDGLKHAARLWFAASGGFDVAVVVPSTRVAAEARELGFGRVIVCNGAGSDAIVEGLGTLRDLGVR